MLDTAISMQITNLQFAGLVLFTSALGGWCTRYVWAQEPITETKTVQVETVIYKTTDQPCLQWELANDKALGHTSPHWFQGLAPDGWEPIGATRFQGGLYRRCIAVTPEP